MAAIKIHDWDAEAVAGDDSSCVISFKLSNVIGVNYFVDAFNAGKRALNCRDGFSSFEFLSAIMSLGSTIYAALKKAKTVG